MASLLRRAVLSDSLTAVTVALILAGLSGVPASAQRIASPQEMAQVQVVKQDSFNLSIEGTDETGLYFIPDEGAAHHWFGVTLDRVPTGVVMPVHIAPRDEQEVRINHWRDLRPMLTYADPARYESYAWFYKDDQNVWQNGDPLLPADKREAGTGHTPRQHVMPEEAAAEFLTPDGRTWTPWREVEGAVLDEQDRRLSLPLVSSQARVSLAMRVPFSYTYLQQFLERLQAAKLPGVFVDEIGTTPEGRKLQVVRIEPLNPAKPTENTITDNPADPIALDEHPTVVVTAREYATDTACSWMALGLILELIADTPESRQLRRDMHYLIIPIQDPDGAAKSVYNHMADAIRGTHNIGTPQAVFDYTSYFIDWVDKKGHTLDVVVGLMNWEAPARLNVGAGPHLSSPYAVVTQHEEVEVFNQGLMRQMTGHGYEVRDTPRVNGEIVQGGFSVRLYGWISAQLGALEVVYGVNDRFPTKRLAHYETQGMGSVLTRYLAEWPHSEDGQASRVRVRSFLSKRGQERREYFEKKGPSGSSRTRYDQLNKGYSSGAKARTE